mgnify:CR=1 FL=1
MSDDKFGPIEDWFSYGRPKKKEPVEATVSVAGGPVVGPEEETPPQVAAVEE